MDEEPSLEKTENKIENNQVVPEAQSPVDQIVFQTNSAEINNKKSNYRWLYVAIPIVLAIVIAVCLAVYFISQNSGEPTDGSNNDNNPTNDIEESNIQSYYSIDTYLDGDDSGFLGTNHEETAKYEIFDNYEEYSDRYESIDACASELYETHVKDTNDNIDEMAKNDSVVDPEGYKVELAEEYKELLDNRVAEIKKGFEKGNYNEQFFDNNYLVLVEYTIYGEVMFDQELKSANYYDNALYVVIKDDSSGVVADVDSLIYFITVPKSQGQTLDSVDIKIEYDNSHHNNGDYPVSKKPIIYLYPTEPTNVSVKLLRADLITTSYPKYSDEWDVFAKPNGDLVDNKTGRSLYSLYYESKNTADFGVKNEGFVVKGEESAEFLEEKLAILGLNEREAEEFIVYWLPRLEGNNYNYIRFASTEEIDKSMPLEVSPQPDSVIRVMMTYKGLDEPISVLPQELQKPERTGFTVVEWGGTEIKQ